MSAPPVAPPPDLPGAITDPSWGYVIASYALAAIVMAGLVVFAFVEARRWAKRAATAREREAAAAKPPEKADAP